MVLGVWYNVDIMWVVGVDICWIVVVGGGIQGQLWLQIVFDVIGLVQEVFEMMIGVSYGVVFFVVIVIVVFDLVLSIIDWNLIVYMICLDEMLGFFYDIFFDCYVCLYEVLKEVVYELVVVQCGGFV